MFNRGSPPEPRPRAPMPPDRAAQPDPTRGGGQIAECATGGVAVGETPPLEVGSGSSSGSGDACGRAIDEGCGPRRRRRGGRSRPPPRAPHPVAGGRRAGVDRGTQRQVRDWRLGRGGRALPDVVVAPRAEQAIWERRPALARRAAQNERPVGEQSLEVERVGVAPSPLSSVVPSRSGTCRRRSSEAPSGSASRRKWRTP